MKFLLRCKPVIIISVLMFLLMAPDVLIPGGSALSIQNVRAGDGLKDCGPNLSVSAGGGTYTLSIAVKDKTKSDVSRYMYNYTDPSEYPWHAVRADVEVVEIGAGVADIGQHAFKNMPNLKAVYLPYSLKEIGSYAFDGCTKLKHVYFTGSFEQWNNLKSSTGVNNDPLLNAFVFSGNYGHIDLNFVGDSGKSHRIDFNKYEEVLYNTLASLEKSDAIKVTHKIQSDYADIDKDGTNDIAFYFNKDTNESGIQVLPDSNLLRQNEERVYYLDVDKDTEIVRSDKEYKYYIGIVFTFPKLNSGDSGTSSDHSKEIPATPAKNAITPAKPAALSSIAKKIKAIKNDKKDVAGSTFSLLQAKGAPAGTSKTLKYSIKYGKLKGSVHRKPAWESGNTNIAKVKAGKISAVSKGTCFVYVYAQNGKMAKVKITVK